jgi:hypothetical protein
VDLPAELASAPGPSCAWSGSDSRVSKETPAMAKKLNVDDIHKALRSQYTDLMTDVSTPVCEHPIEAVATVLLSSAVLDTADVSKLVKFTGYSRPFAAIALNRQNNQLWSHGQYDYSEWFDPQRGIIDDRYFWSHHEVALGTTWRPGAERISVDVCRIYWDETERDEKRE